MPRSRRSCSFNWGICKSAPERQLRSDLLPDQVTHFDVPANPPAIPYDLRDKAWLAFLDSPLPD